METLSAQQLSHRKNSIEALRKYKTITYSTIVDESRQINVI